MCRNSEWDSGSARQGRGRVAGGLAVLCFVALLCPLPIKSGGGAGSFPWHFLVQEARRHHLELSSLRADWIKVLPFKCLIWAQVKWGILITMYIYPIFVK